MKEKKIYRPVNWKLGMSVSPDHFIATENYLLECILQNAKAFRAPFHYGLLPALDDNRSVAITLAGHGEQRTVVLESYKGITPGGYLILLDDPESKITCPCECEGEIPEEGWDILLNVVPFDRNPCGIPDINETPSRYPYVEPTYRLTLLPRNNRKSVAENYLYSVVIGLLRKQDGVYTLDGNYIPPSLSMASHSRLHEYMADFTREISILDNAVKKIVEKTVAQPNRTPIAENVLLLCKDFSHTLSMIYFEWRNKAHMLTPYEVVKTLTSFASTILTSLCFLSIKEKETMLKYFHEWNGISPSTFEQLLDEVVNKSYDHNRINQSLVAVQGMLHMLEELFTSLSRLEFIGQHRESIVISERQMQDTVSESNRWTLVD